nr:aminotransferase class I/II-fold pyridoxal phosphate-dependent enzyme [Spelaeicoccus albus]
MKWTRYPDVTGAWVAEMDFGVAGPITDALHKAVDAGGFGYLPPAMEVELSAAAADWYTSRYGWNVAPERIRPLPDVLTGLDAAIDHFSVPGSKVILPTPAYMPFMTVPGAHHRDIIQVPMSRTDDGWNLDLDAIDKAFDDGGDLLIFCNPHNPIGKVYSKEEMLAVAEVVDRHGGRVFSDEIHAPLIYPGSGSRHIPYASVSEVAAGHTVTAASASKAFNLPGLKCAQLILSNDADATTWARIGHPYEHGASNLGVVANVAAYTQGSEWLAGTLDYLDGNRKAMVDLVAEQLPGVGFLPPSGTYLAWLDCRDLDLGDHPFEFFMENAGVACTDGALCGEAGKCHIRFNFATPRPVLTAALERMGRALAAR